MQKLTAVLATCMLLTAAGCQTPITRDAASTSTSPPLVDAMSPTSTTTELRFSLNDEDYWSRPSSQQLTLTKKLAREGFDGVLIAAPSEVPVDARETLPLVALRAGSYQQLFDLDLKTHGHLAVMDLQANHLMVAPAIDLTDEEIEEQEPPSSKGYSGSLELVELRERLELDWLPGEYLVAVVLRDRISNRERVKLVRSSGSYRTKRWSARSRNGAAGVPLPVSGRSRCRPTRATRPWRALPPFQWKPASP